MEDKFIVKHYSIFEDKEIEVDLREFTGLNVGDKIKHRNRGVFAGSNGKIKDQIGTVRDIIHNGTYADGSICVLVNVLWEDGENYNMVYHLAEKM